MSLNALRRPILWFGLVALVILLTACETTREPKLPIPEPSPIATPELVTVPERLVFSSDDPPLSFTYPAVFSLKELLEESGRRYVLDSGRSARVEFEVRPLMQAIDIQALGRALVSVDQGQMADSRGAEVFSVFQETSLAGEQGLSYTFTLREQSGKRILIPVKKWMYTVTILPGGAEEAGFLDEVLRTVRFQAAATEPPSTPGPTSVLAPPASVSESDIPAMLWSFCPYRSELAGNAIAQGLLREPSEPRWLALNAEQQSLRIITFNQQRRAAREKDVERLAREAEQAARVLEGSAQASRALGLALLVNEKMSDSRAALSTAAQMSAEQTYGLLALALWHGPVASEVEPLLSRVEALNPDIPAIWLIRAWLAHVRGDGAGAETALRRALSIDPRNTAALIGLGRLEMDDPRTRVLAAERFQQVLGINAHDDVALYNLAVIRLQEADHDQALVLVRRLVEQYPRDAPAWNLKGQVFRAKGQHQEAARAFRTAIEADQQLASAHFHLGVLCAEQLADTACAKAAFTEYLRLQPEGARARQVREWMNRN
ncbi:tetratricopeptide repeat protein [Desulfonatronum thiodismutans]|uniref:tetratricopeptide repeat protein n=1 Tax=Desulfonatronum thiodismutans TaxID=159290 RepID=UPI0004ABE046|nr:tetratricopeptide repeat protein [Desulfonatronum thiodismutans]